MPRLVFINKMDVVGANFDNAVAEVAERLEGKPVAVDRPIGSGSAKDSTTPFSGVIDLLAMKALFFDPADRGQDDPRRADPGRPSRRCPGLARAAVRRPDPARRAGPPDQRLPRRAGRSRRGDPRRAPRADAEARRFSRCCAAPAASTSASSRCSTPSTWYLPSPLDRPPVTGTNPKKKDKEEKRKPDPKEPFCGLVFKVVADEHRRAVLRPHLLRHAASRKTRPTTPAKTVKELVSKIYHTMADPNDRAGAARGLAGDIVAVIGLKDSITGDTLCDYAPPDFAGADSVRRAVVSRSIEPESSADKQKLADVLNLLNREDPTFQLAASIPRPARR